jgi:O-methyltransferase
VEDLDSAVEPFMMLFLERVLVNIRAIDYVVANRIAGDIVECGVWRGGSSMAMALALDGRARPLWLYDTFAGMTDATDADLSNSGEKASALLESAKKYEVPERSLVLAFASLEDVTRNIDSTAYPASLVRFIQGPVEQTIPNTMPE